MKNWKTILWLLLFFPVGITLMFKDTAWSNRTKCLITTLFVVLTSLAMYSGILLDLILISGLLVLLTGFISTFYSFTRSKEHKSSIAILFLGLLLFGFSFQQINVRTQKEFALAEQVRIEEEARIEQEKQQLFLVEATSTVEKAEQEPTRDHYDKAFASVAALSQKHPNLVDRLKVIDELLLNEEKIKEATLLVEKAEKNSTRPYYEEATIAVTSLSPKNEELEKRLKSVEELLVVEELKIEEAETLLVQAEKSKTRNDYEQAQLLITSLPSPNNNLVKRLETLDSDIQKQEKQAIEEQKIKEEKALAAEQARVEEEQLAVAQAAQEEVVTNVEYDDSVDTNENIEGAIKGSNSGIYHVPGSTYYDRTTNVVQWFNTIEEAEAAGYRAPKR